MNETLIIIAVPILRSAAGWLQNALEDGKITIIEWKKLLKTVLRLGIPGFALYYGFDFSPEFSACVPLIVDYAFAYFKNLKK